MTSPAKLYALSATQVLDLLRSDAITVEEYASSLLDRIGERDSVVRAWAFIDPQLILNQARALDQVAHAQRGPLHGIAVGIKDVFSTRDMPTQYGSLLYEGNHSGLDSAPVEILRRAGALIFGKTTTSEFTFPNSGPDTTNPHDASRTPGGSSAGSAAAVADFQVPLSIGTQTGGSVIRPASYTGIWAMKPTFSVISIEDVKPCSPSLDTFGFFARDAEDLQLMANIFALRDDEMPRDVPLNELRVVFTKTAHWPNAGPGTIAEMEQATKILSSHGVFVEELQLPEEFNNAAALSQMSTTIIYCEAQASFLKDYRINKAKLDPRNRAVVENVSNLTHKEQLQSLDKLARLQSIFGKIADQYSAIITPSAPDIAPAGTGDFGPATFNSLWTGLHTPHGLPVGLSIVAGRFRDQHLLAISKILGKPLIAEGNWNITPPSIEVATSAV
ncbi:amidase signature domain-containing protein [Xylogone sp. PMI_703]|nr:amidase signature domain-containing protein [Xylogone sp. PMI_703]